MKEYVVKVFNDGVKYWYFDDKLHREDGPAVECPDEHREWWLNGKLHREDGPAIEYTSGYKAWFLHGRELTEAGFKWWLSGKQLKEECNARHCQELTVAEISERLGYEVKVVK